jgi:hypothetical protein
MKEVLAAAVVLAGAVTSVVTAQSKPSGKMHTRQVFVAVPARGIAAHGIVLKARSGGLPEIVTSHVVQNAGGLYDVMNTSNSLPARLAAIAQQPARDFESVQTKYEIVFQTDATENGPVSIGVAREGAILQMTNGRLR